MRFIHIDVDPRRTAIKIPTPINHQRWFRLRLQVILVAYVSCKARQVQALPKVPLVSEHNSQ